MPRNPTVVPAPKIRVEYCPVCNRPSNSSGRPSCFCALLPPPIELEPVRLPPVVEPDPEPIQVTRPAPKAGPRPVPEVGGSDPSLTPAFVPPPDEIDDPPLEPQTPPFNMPTLPPIEPPEPDLPEFLENLPSWVRRTETLALKIAAVVFAVIGTVLSLAPSNTVRPPATTPGPVHNLRRASEAERARTLDETAKARPTAVAEGPRKVSGHRPHPSPRTVDRRPASAAESTGDSAQRDPVTGRGDAPTGRAAATIRIERSSKSGPAESVDLERARTVQTRSTVERRQSRPTPAPQRTIAAAAPTTDRVTTGPEIVVEAPDPARAARPRRTPVIPETVRRWLAQQSGALVTAIVRVDRRGRPTIERWEHDRPISNFVLARLRDTLLGTPWHPATDRTGRPVETRIRVVFKLGGRGSR